MDAAIAKGRVPALGALAAFFVAVLLMMAIASSAKAEEHQFCWGKNLPYANSCASANWFMNAAYADSSEGPVCLYMSGGETWYGCEKKATEGIYHNVGCYCYGYASIHNYGTGKTVKVYGVFWTQ